jgi:hypothetical protein
VGGLRKLLSGGSAGNEQLTAIVATILLVLLAAEGATLLHMQSLLTAHAFIGMLLIPVVALKLGSTGWKMLRYYLGGEEYVRRGPPHPFIRMLVAPVLVVSTISLFATGVWLLAIDRTGGMLVGLHKASFVVWLGAMGIHVLTRIWSLPAMLRWRETGAMLRVAAIGGTLALGVVLATLTLPAADHLQDTLSAQIGLDPG